MHVFKARARWFIFRSTKKYEFTNLDVRKNELGIKFCIDLAFPQSGKSWFWYVYDLSNKVLTWAIR
jgi:hypothetical protein